MRFTEVIAFCHYDYLDRPDTVNGHHLNNPVQM
jgi:hypothetical protein